LPPQGALHGFANASIIASGLPIPKAQHLRTVQVDEIGVYQNLGPSSGNIYV
jgi:hypothetical protein